MISGHLGVAFALRSLITARGHGDDRRWLLPALIAASFVPDIVDSALLQAGMRGSFGLYSHSILVISWLAAAVFTLAIITVRSVGLAALLGAAVLLHLPADLITGEKTLWRGAPLIGLDLYRWPIADFFLEVPVVAAGWSLMRRSRATRAIHPLATSWPGLWLLIGLQAAINTFGLLGGSLKP